MDPIASILKSISTSIENISKRLRRVEVLARLSSDTGIDEFLELVDVDEDTYLGNAGLFVHVKLDESGLEFSPVGSACVTFICGSPGWRGYGGNPIRTLVHEWAFQVDSDGNDRGHYAVDLQQLRSTDADVAAAWASFIQGEENRISADGDYSVAIGSNQKIDAGPGGTPFANWSYGYFNDIVGDTFLVCLFAESCDLEDINYAFISGSDQDSVTSNNNSAFGIFMFLESNTFRADTTQYPTYTGVMGINCEQIGDVWLTFQMGEELYAKGDNTGGNTTMWNAMVGFDSYLNNVRANLALGQHVKSWNPVGSSAFYDGRIVWNGDYSILVPTDVSPTGSGFNQDSLFAQSDQILSWPAAFTTSRFQFPIIQDSIWFFEAYIAGTEQGCNNSYAWKIEGVVENDGGTTTILAQTVTNVYRDVATKEWQAAADDVNDRLIFQYRDTAGPDATDCNIQFLLQTVEVGWQA